ncbi:MAG: ATP-binding protein [Myxococcota bacterium]
MANAYEEDPTPIETLLAMVEHEVRSPLNAIIGFASLLRSDMDQRELDELVARIRSNAEHLGDVVEALAQPTRSNDDRRASPETPQNLRALLEEIVAFNRGIANEKRIALSVSLGSDVPHDVLCERGKVRVLVQNLISNALKYTDGGQVIVRVTCVQQDRSAVRLCYAVEDTGPGIPADAQDSILEAFVRGEHTRGAPGDGLGLAICARLLESSGSRIEIESAASEGTVVSFELSHGLPEARPGAAERTVAHTEATLGHETNSGSVLLVDDDEDSLEVLRRLVRREGLVADVARSGHAALSMALRREYAVIMTDLNMSGMSGVELGRRIRESGAKRAESVPPLVAVTASAALRGRDAQDVCDVFDDVLLKPIRPRVLSRMLAPYQPGSRPSPAREPSPEEPLDTSVFQVALDYPARRLRDVRVLRAFLGGRASIEQVVTIGHRMKGTAATYGHPRLGELGAALEAAGRDADATRIAWITDSIEHLLSRSAPARLPDGKKRGA